MTDRAPYCNGKATVGSETDVLCLRRTADPTGLCYQHRNQETPPDA